MEQWLFPTDSQVHRALLEEAAGVHSWQFPRGYENNSLLKSNMFRQHQIRNWYVHTCSHSSYLLTADTNLISSYRDIKINAEETELCKEKLVFAKLSDSSRL